MMSKQNLIKIAVNSLIGVSLIWLWLKLVNLEQVLNTLKSAQLAILSLFLAAFLLSTLLRALRLKILLNKYHLGLIEGTKLLFVSQLLSFVIPIRAGEIAKAVYLNNQHDVPLGKTVVWILMDRFLDFWSVLLMLVILLPIVNLSYSKQIYPLVLLAFFAFTLPVAGLLIFPKRTKIILIYCEKILFVNLIKSIYRKIVDNVIEGFEIMHQNISQLPKLILISVIALLSDSLAWMAVFASLTIGLPYLKLLSGSLLSMLTFLVPSAPGYVGSAEAAGLAVFSGILGVDSTAASAAIVLSHILIILCLPTFGILSLYFLKFNLSAVWKKLRSNH